MAATTLRITVRLTLLVAAACTALLFFSGEARADSFADSELRFTESINRERAANGLAPLQMDAQLTRVARSWTDVMAGEDRMYHNPNLAQQITGDWQRVGENVGYTFMTPADASQLVDSLHVAFMNSPGHRANVLGDYNLVGVGVTITADNKMWVTVNFSLATPAATGQVAEAVKVSEQVFAADSAGYVVLGRSDLFADALGGSGLAGDDAPVLFTPGPNSADANPILDPMTAAEIDRVLPAGGTVYLLGGEVAVSQRVEADLRGAGYDVRRLAGGGRVATSIAVAREAIARHGQPEKILLARADDWADAISGGAYAAWSGNPVILTGSDALDAQTEAFIAELGVEEVVALGGQAALKDQVVADANARRVAGADRTATAVEIARQLWGRTAGADGQEFVTAPGYTADGWASALAYAPYSARTSSPQLLVGDEVSPAVATYLAQLGYAGDLGANLTASTTVPERVVAELSTFLGG